MPGTEIEKRLRERVKEGVRKARAKWHREEEKGKKKKTHPRGDIHPHPCPSGSAASP
jgi:hypothetical protein